MSLRAEIIEALTAAGWPVVPWGRVTGGRFVMVRPGGIQGDRALINVWIVNPRESVMDDPDEGLHEAADAIYDLLRPKLVQPFVQPGAPYDPMPTDPRKRSAGSNAHSTMVLIGADPRRRGLTG